MALVLGAIYCLGFAPFDYWPVTFVAIAGLFWLFNQVGINVLLAAWLFGLGKYAVGASWIYVSIHVYGGAPPILAGFLVVLFVAGLALLFSLPLGWLIKLQKPQQNPVLLNVTVFATAWMVMDWVSTWLLTGFPWLLPGYAFMNTTLLASAPVVGVIGMSFLVVLSSAGLAGMVLQRRVGKGLVAVFLLPWLLGWGLEFMQWVKPGQRQAVALVQGNLDQSRKWLREEAKPNVQKHIDLTEPHWDADLIVWPEAAITMFPQQAQGILAKLASRAIKTDTNVVLGIPGVQGSAEEGYSYQNLALGLGLARGRYAKQHLVPFGEYVPLEGLLRGLIEFFDLPMSSSSPGRMNQPNIRLSFGEVAMAICYEVAYPASMRRHAQTATLLMTISNDTWFGASIGPLQHMQIARMRAVENGRWLVRATNNGVTAIVDHLGTITAQIPQFEASVLRGWVVLMQGRTPYSVVGHWPIFGVVVICLAMIVGLRRRKLPNGALTP
ncbi:MAG: apolipoprotein N-acyltransferase [Gammaproteobacteria bacterium]|nr:apolipoprotein N-acyltransferase [Gammaproteobacteria bacterium]